MATPNHKIYTSEDIQRYHSGGMSQAEMHAMEKAALEDPFLADAIEGYTFSHNAQAELADIRTRLDKRSETKVIPMAASRKSFGWMRIAALLVILAGAGWFLLQQNSFDKDDAIVQKAPVEKENSVAIGNSADVSADQRSDTTTTEETTVPEHRDETFAVAEPKVSFKRGSVSAPSVGEVTDKAETDDQATVIYKDSISFDAVTSQQVEVTANKAAAYRNNNGAYGEVAQKLNTVQGIVTDNNRNAIPFASVILRNHSGTLTDNNGRFELKVPDTATAVDVNALGYESRNINLKEARADQPIILQESNDQLEEVVIARTRNAYQARKNPVPKQIVEIGELEPEGGWSAYNEYIAEKITSPKQPKKKVSVGVVELSFDVDEKGNPVNITVEKSLSTKYDQEAIRLLKEGPKWKKQDGKGKITIRF